MLFGKFKQYKNSNIAKFVYITGKLGFKRRQIQSVPILNPSQPVIRTNLQFANKVLEFCLEIREKNHFMISVNFYMNVEDVETQMGRILAFNYT